ncbi:hypothetical protein GCM10007962_10860 [Yeosuana aromativorans]|uniref:Uncharacterized protein n=1 Tax=Yeosuana aromativorans TaxID=288019 RepID=A0A8J3BFY3_9FLAO|nr:hypothetical protein GCM10007962_10860 [Yeosuana aromativorans]
MPFGSAVSFEQLATAINNSVTKKYFIFFILMYFKINYNVFKVWSVIIYNVKGSSNKIVSRMFDLKKQ